MLQAAADATAGDRQRDYGDPAANFRRIAALWSVYLGREITPRQVCMLNVLQKVARDSVRAKRDNLVDIAGYAQCAGRCD